MGKHSIRCGILCLQQTLCIPSVILCSVSSFFWTCSCLFLIHRNTCHHTHQCRSPHGRRSSSLPHSESKQKESGAAVPASQHRLTLAENRSLSSWKSRKDTPRRLNCTKYHYLKFVERQKVVGLPGRRRAWRVESRDSSPLCSSSSCGT